MPARSMRALVVDGPGRYEVRDVTRPAPEREEVVVRVDYRGICGTDLEIVSGRYPVPNLPLVIGHEFAGEVVATGDGVGCGRLGETVAVGVIASCGTCNPCRRGARALCDHPSELGIHRPGG